MNGQANSLSATTDLERRPHASNVSDMQAQEVMRMEEVGYGQEKYV